MARPFVPSGWHLQRQIEAAMAKADGDREQALAAEEARQERRALRLELARARAQQQARRLAFWAKG